MRGGSSENRICIYIAASVFVSYTGIQNVYRNVQFNFSVIITEIGKVKLLMKNTILLCSFTFKLSFILFDNKHACFQLKEINV